MYASLKCARNRALEHIFRIGLQLYKSTCCIGWPVKLNANAHSCIGYTLCHKLVDLYICTPFRRRQLLCTHTHTHTRLSAVLCIASAPYVPPPYETDSIQKEKSVEQEKPIPWYYTDTLSSSSSWSSSEDWTMWKGYRIGTARWSTFAE